MLGPTLVPSVNSIVRTIWLSGRATAAAACEVQETQYGPLAEVWDSSWPCFHNIGSMWASTTVSRHSGNIQFFCLLRF